MPLTSTPQAVAAPITEAGAGFLPWLAHAWDKLAFGVRTRADFYTSMADFSNSGIAPYRAIGEMRGVAEDRITKRSKVKVYSGILAVLDEGRGLSAAVAPWVPAAEATMLRGAEAAGPNVLIQTFTELGTLLTRQAEARIKLLKALGANIGAMVVMIGIMVEIVSTLVPELARSITPAQAVKMPFAMAYFGISEWILEYGVFLAIGFVLFCIFIAVLLPTWASDRRRFLDQYIPPFSLYQRLQATMFLSTTAGMMRAGVTFNSVLADLGAFGSRWLRFHIANMSDVLKSGAGEVQAIAAGPLPNDTADKLRVYRLIPAFQDVMTRLAESNFKAYESSIAVLSGVMSLVSMLMMTIFGASTVIAMFDFSDAMRASAQAVQHIAGG